MTTYIVDASVVVQLVVIEENAAEVEALFDSMSDSNQLIVPEFCLLECANVLWKHVRFSGLAQSEAEILIEELIALDIVISPTRGLMSRALKIGLKYQLAIYDSVYIALAEELSYPLITDDVKQAKAAAAEGITLKPITDFSSS